MLLSDYFGLSFMIYLSPRSYLDTSTTCVLKLRMDSRKTPVARGQTGPSPALSGASPAPMELGLDDAEVHLFSMEEEGLMDAVLGVEVVEEEKKEEELCEDERIAAG